MTPLPISINRGKGCRRHFSCIRNLSCWRSYLCNLTSNVEPKVGVLYPFVLLYLYRTTFFSLCLNAAFACLVGVVCAYLIATYELMFTWALSHAQARSPFFSFWGKKIAMQYVICVPSTHINPRSSDSCMSIKTWPWKVVPSAQGQSYSHL